MLTCPKCKQAKNFEAFARNKARASGFNSYCKPCLKSYYVNDRQRRIDRVIRWRKENPEGRKKEAKKRYAANKAYFYAKSAERRAIQNKAIPPWADLDAIRALYTEARKRNDAGEAVHVDHIVPLRGKTVCGLHTLANLQIVPAAENWSKNNRHWPDMP